MNEKFKQFLNKRFSKRHFEKGLENNESSVIKIKIQDRGSPASRTANTTRETGVDQIVSRRRVYILVRVCRYIHKDLFVSE